MAGKKKAAETEKKVTVEAQKEQTQPAATQAPAASQEPKTSVANKERIVLATVIKHALWKRVKDVLSGYKWSSSEHSIIAGAVNFIHLHNETISVANVQLAIGRLYPQEKVNVSAIMKDVAAPELLLPLAKQLIANK